MWSGQPLLRSRRKTRTIQLSLPSSQERRGAGVRLGRGSQTIRLVFDQPQRLKHVSLVFEENETARTQEFVLRWSPEGGSSSKEIVRQQWNFSPPETTREVEEYQVELSNVTALELIITPNMSGGDARASLKSMRLS